MIDRYRIASNGEIVLILYSIESAQYMNVYLPNPNCLGPRSRDRDEMIAARQELTSHCPTVLPAWQLLGITVDVTGVGFWNPSKRNAWRIAERRGAPAADELQDRLGVRDLSRVAVTPQERRRVARRLSQHAADPALAAKRGVQFSLLILLVLLLAVVGNGLFATYNLYRSAEDRYVRVALPLQTLNRDVLFRMSRGGERCPRLHDHEQPPEPAPYFTGRKAVLRIWPGSECSCETGLRSRDRLQDVEAQVRGLHGFYDRLIVFVADGQLGLDRARREALDGERSPARFGRRHC